MVISDLGAGHSLEQLVHAIEFQRVFGFPKSLASGEPHFGVRAMNPEAENSLVQRIREIASEVGGLDALARQSGVNRRTLGHYLAGREPKVSALVDIAQTVQVSLDWLVMGRGPKRLGSDSSDSPQIQGYGWDPELMLECIREIEELLEEMEKEMSPSAKAAFILQVYARELDKRQQGAQLSAPEKIRMLKRAG